MKKNFEPALLLTLTYEGGYVDHPDDPGGATNLGITIKTLSKWLGRPATKAEVKALTTSKVKPIYREWYWKPVRGDELPSGVDLVTFDGAVNSGPGRSAKWTQKAVGVTADGKIGPVTLQALAEANPVSVIKRAVDLRLAYLQGLAIWKTFGRGWARRVGDVLATALAWVGQSPSDIRQYADDVTAAGKEDAKKAASTGAGGVAAGGGAAVPDLTSFDWPAIVALCVLAVLMFGATVYFSARSRAKKEVANAARFVAEKMEVDP